MNGLELEIKTTAFKEDPDNCSLLWVVETTNVSYNKVSVVHRLPSPKLDEVWLMYYIHDIRRQKQISSYFGTEIEVSPHFVALKPEPYSFWREVNRNFKFPVFVDYLREWVEDTGF